MSEKKLNQFAEETEISYSNIFIKIKATFRFLLSKWWILCIALVVGSIIGWTIHYLYGVKYTSNCSFTIQGQSASSSLLNSALSLASSIGISAKPGTGSYDNNFFANLMKSRRILKHTLLEDGMIDGKKDIMINHFIKVTGINDDWEGDKRLDGFKFKHNEIHALTRLEDSVLTLLYNKILDEYLTVTYDESSPFNQAKFTTPNYSFSNIFMQKLLKNTSNYYINDMYSLNNANLRIAERRVDSLANAIRSLDVKVASLKDNSNNVVKQKGLVELNSAIRDQGLLSIQYSSAVNNYELAKVTLTTDTPILEVIDDPQFSTEVSLIPIVIAIAGGAIGFFFLALIGLMAWNFVGKSMANEQQLNAA